MADRKTAVVLVNLGTPDAPTPAAVRRYLKQFLSDPRVVEVPRAIWFWVLRLVILPLRPGRVARLYRSVWQSDSPIRLFTAAQARGLSQRLPVPVHHAMTYGTPGLPAVLDGLVADGVEHLVILPLFPQYSATTTGALVDALSAWSRGRRELPGFSVIKDYWQEEAWLDAMAESIRRYRQNHGSARKLLFSFHGIPLSCEQKGDRYGDRCRQTAALIARRLELDDDAWAVTFQSRFGSQEWLQPYTDKTLEAWGREGVESVQVVCPGFAADCLETLEEIDSQNRDIFLRAGGRSFAYIPALNDDAVHLDALAGILRPWLNQ